MVVTLSEAEIQAILVCVKSFQWEDCRTGEFLESLQRITDKLNLALNPVDVPL